ncbi:MAG: sialidase family protein [Rhodothermales bacterium]
MPTTLSVPVLDARRLVLVVLGFLLGLPASGQTPLYEAEELFAPQPAHVHGSTIVALPGGQFLAAWFQGSGERQADDVAIMGARFDPDTGWSTPFLMADTPDFPDINPVLFRDPRGRVWLVWYTVIAGQWETSLLKYRICDDPGTNGAPDWDWQDVILVRPGDPAGYGIQPGDRFVRAIREKGAAYAAYLRSGGVDPAEWLAHVAQIDSLATGRNWIRAGRLYDAEGGFTTQPLGYPYFRRMGWQTRNKPLVLDDGRILLPLYSDGFDLSIVAITDDLGAHWSFSEPLVGDGNIQPAILARDDGTLVAYMRDNGGPPKRLHVSESADRGMTWSPVTDSELPNPGAAADAVELANGHWAVIYNDVEEGRSSLAVSISDDEGRTWKWTRHLERDDRPEGARRSHYPAIIQTADGSLHAIYTHQYTGANPARTIKHARFNEAWIRQGDTP